MRMRDCLPTDEILTHVDPDDGTVRHINASAMARHVPEGREAGYVSLITAAMDREFMEKVVIPHRGTEQWKLDRLCEPYISTPILGVKIAGGTVLTVDGHHRLVRLYKQNAPTYDMYVYEEGAWERFVISDVPSDLSRMIVGQLR